MRWKIVIVEFICKKSFTNKHKISLVEGLVYKARKGTDVYGDYYVIYNDAGDDFQIFDPTYEKNDGLKLKANSEEYPCILEFFYTKAEWREKQINSIFE